MRKMGSALALSILINFGWGLIVPLFPILLKDYGGEMYAVYLSFFLLNILSAVFRFPVGYMADVKGRGKFIILSCVISALSSAVAIPFMRWETLLACMAILGIAFAFYFQAQYALAADLVGNKAVGKSYALLRFTQYAGWMMGPGVSGFLMQIGRYEGIFEVALASFIISIPFAVMVSRLERYVPSKPRGIQSAMMDVWRLCSALLIAELFVGCATGMIMPTLPIFLKEDLGATYVQTGMIMLLCNLCDLCAFIPSGFLTDRYGGKKVFMISSIIEFCVLSAWSIANSLEIFFVLCVAYFIPNGVGWIAGDGLVATSIPEKMRALALGSYWAMYRFGYALTSLAIMFATLAMHVDARFLFISASVMTFLSFISISRFKTVQPSANVA